MTYAEIVDKVAESTGLTPRFVDRVYKGYWKAIRSHITSLPLKEDLTDEEFLALKPNVNIPSIGKLYVSLDRYKKLKYVYNKTAK
jgi:hypothetical protein